mgnify:CR=1 FL=1|jgi:type II secretory pathway pseudopilin PulG
MVGLKSVQKQLARKWIAGNQRGGVLLFLLVAVTILGLSAGIAGSTWTSIVQRSKEADLLWKGNQIRAAIGSYYETPGAPGTPLQYPQSVDDLLKDNRSLKVRRHLRQPYLDPMTGEDWEWIKAPEGGFKGVRSTSHKTPFKKDGFSEENKTFVGMYQYRDWEFIYLPKKKVEKQKVKVTPGTIQGTGTIPGTGTAPGTGTTPGATQ